MDRRFFEYSESDPVVLNRSSFSNEIPLPRFRPMLDYLLMKRIPLTISIVLLLCFHANGQSKVDRGVVHDGTYINTGFGFTYTYPKDWAVHGEATNQQIKKSARGNW